MYEMFQCIKRCILIFFFFTIVFNSLGTASFVLVYNLHVTVVLGPVPIWL